jgi:phosphoenolpyruvate carboxykinase (GTP)
MEAQFEFFNSPLLVRKPVMAGLNYFLTHQARGGPGTGLLGEKRDVKVWLGWLELLAHGDVDTIPSPIGLLPKYEDLRRLFEGIGKRYPPELYEMQFSLYVDNMLDHIALQEDAYGAEPGIPVRLFEVYTEQREGLEELRASCGSVVSVKQLIASGERLDCS